MKRWIWVLFSNEMEKGKMFGKIGKSYSLEVATTPRVTFFWPLSMRHQKRAYLKLLTNFFRVLTPEISRFLKYHTDC